MKKHFILFISALLVTCVFTSCIDPDSTYFDDWTETEGYAVTKSVNNGRSDENSLSFESFVPTNTIPEDQTIAVCYKHALGSSKHPYCTITVEEPQTNIEEDIVDEYVETKKERIYVSESAKFIFEGIIIYCDDEFVYVINDLYKYNYRDHTKTKPKAQYHIEIFVRGMKPLDFYLNHISTSHPLGS